MGSTYQNIPLTSILNSILIYIKCLDCLDFQTELFDVSAEQLATSTEDLFRTGRIQFKVLTTLPLKFKDF